jgi:cytochrome c2
MPLSELDSLNLGRRDRRGKTLHADAQARFAAFIANPRGKEPGNKMAFARIKDETEIANLWAYLSHFDVDGTR